MNEINKSNMKFVSRTKEKYFQDSKSDCELSDIDEDEIIPLAVLPDIKLPCHSLNLGLMGHPVIVTAIQSPNCFYVHLKCNEQYFDEFCETLYTFYSKKSLSPMSSVIELPLGSHWCVSYQGSWLRGKVTKSMGKKFSKQNGLSSLHFEMLFVDFGFTRHVALKEVYYLEKQFTFDPPFAVPCSLSQVTPPSQWSLNPWPDDELYYFYGLFSEKEECKAIFVDYNDVTYDIVLELLDGTVINEELIKKGFATSDIITKFMNGTKKPLEMTTQPAEDKPQVLGAESWEPMLNDFLDDRNTVHHNDECAESMLLGVVNKDESNLCKFYSRGKICRRGDTCQWLHITARRDGLPTDIEIAYCQLESDFIIPEDGTLENIIVTTVLSPGNFYVYIPSTGRDGEVDLLSELQEDLHDVYFKSANLTSNSEPSPGELMVVCNCDGPLMGFYRVRILSVEEKSVEVLYIDLGAVDWVLRKQLRKLTPQFLRPPAQALACYLEDVMAKGGRWKSAATDYFQKLTVAQELTALIASRDRDEDKIGLVIIDPRNESKTINEAIVDAGFGYLTSSDPT